MSCLVRLYDSNFVDLCQNNIQIAAINQGPPPFNCCGTQSNQSVLSSGGQSGCGADLAFAEAAIVYQVAIHDTAGSFAGTTLPDLNGNHPGDFNVILYAAPSSGSNQGQIGAPASPAQMQSFIEEQREWTEENKHGVKSVAKGLISLVQLIIPSSDVDEVVWSFIHGYAEFLGSRGIDPAIFNDTFRAERI